MRFVERVFRKFIFPADEGVLWAARAVFYARRWMKGPHKPVVLSTFPPVSTHTAGYLLKRLYGPRWIADFRDPLSDNPFRAHPSLDRHIETTIFSHADAILANTDVVADLWRSRRSDVAGKIDVLWNGFDPESVPCALPIPPRPYRVLCHIGSIYGNRNPGLVLDSVLRLIESGRLGLRDLRVQLIGTMDPAHQPLLERLQTAGVLESSEKQLPRAEAWRIAGESDYLLLLDVMDQEKVLQLPAKIFEYVAIGRPILVSTAHDSPADRILRQAGMTYRRVYSDMPAQQVDNTILEFLHLPPGTTTPSSWYEQTFNGAAQAETLSALIGRVAGSPVR
jgi:hypothetical protein